MTPDDHPHVAHYTWPATAGESHERPSGARRAANLQHAADRLLLERGRSLRLVAAVPLVLWSFIGGGLIFLTLIVVGVTLASDAHVVADLRATPDLVAFELLALVLEVATVWASSSLISDRVRPRSWPVIAGMSLVPLVAGSAWLVPMEDPPRPALLGLGVAAYALIIALWQWRRVARLRGVLDRVRQFSP